MQVVRRQLIVIWMLFGMASIEICEQIQIATLMFPRDPVRWIQIQNGRSLGAERRSLKAGRQESVGPVRGTSLRVGHFRHHDEARQILVLRTESVIHPRTEGRVAAEPVPRVHVVVGRRMVDRFGLASAVDAQVIRHVGQMLPVFAQLDSRLASPMKLERTLQEVSFPRRHGRGKLVFTNKFLHVQLVQLWLRIERVDVARATCHEQENTRFGLGGVMTDAGCRCLDGGIDHTLLLFRQQVRKGDRSEARTQTVEKRSTRRMLNKHR